MPVLGLGDGRSLVAQGLRRDAQVRRAPPLCGVPLVDRRSSIPSPWYRWSEGRKRNDISKFVGVVVERS